MWWVVDVFARVSAAAALVGGFILLGLFVVYACFLRNMPVVRAIRKEVLNF